MIGQIASILASRSTKKEKFKMLIVELSMTPIGKGESITGDVAKLVDIIDKSDLDYKLGPMGTCIEGDWDDVLGVVRDCYNVLSVSNERISFSIKGDWRRGGASRLNQKTESIENVLGRKIKM